MNDVIGSVRQVIQAPELRQHRAELVSILGELSAKIEAVESKIVAVETRLDSKIDAVESRLESKINVVDSKVDVLRSEVRSGSVPLVRRSKMQYFGVSYPRPVKSPTSVSALRDWKKNAASCLSS